MDTENWGEKGMVSGAGLEPATTGLKVRCADSASGDMPHTYKEREDPVAPSVAPETGIDRKKALLEALRGVDRETLLEILADVLLDKESHQI